FYCGLERRQIVGDGVPDVFAVYAVVLMPEPIADSANIAPWHACAENFGGVTQPNGSLANDEKLSFHGCLGFEILAVSLDVHSAHEFVDGFNAFANVAEMGLWV